jgi:hypothetical protein
MKQHAKANSGLKQDGFFDAFEKETVYKKYHIDRRDE